MNLLSSVSSEGALDDEESPQGKASLWVTIDDTISPPLQPGTNDDQIIQRYVLAAFYYATSGDGWTNGNGWLGSSNECEWVRVDCSCDVVTVLEPYANNLDGSIPTELGSLDSLGKDELLLIYIDIGPLSI
ncbi:hypothetical protein QTG54_009744 [Skeletonema marinoi]|uniref:Leucine-rich repeat-containing N-terminal plant-type domain-containing protein n=1 Tax=Skeletonema marinoi TaxID=267567 RepID=A0AAD8Y5M3_9STRA|nr:hypothetical protein QTG54_009744 [Skeletonema marinoi]